MRQHQRMDLTEIKQLKVGDQIYIRIQNRYISAKVMRPMFWNSDADEPGLELETTNGFTDIYSVYR